MWPASCAAHGLLEVLEVVKPLWMTLETECVQEVVEQELQEPEERLVHQLEALEAVDSLEHQLAHYERSLVAR